ncbi:hypothetical protein G6F68_019351 [Rhizopus microsporus]|nr:hypothetical protein G6F68_019351 [Rhizopus microsporus]
MVSLSVSSPSTRFRRPRDSSTACPPASGVAPPIKPVLPPCGTTGTPAARHKRNTAATSSASAGRATASASSYFSSRIRRANILLPVTLVRSPTLTYSVSSSMFRGSRPDRRVLTGMSGTTRGVSAATLSAM